MTVWVLPFTENIASLQIANYCSDIRMYCLVLIAMPESVSHQGPLIMLAWTTFDYFVDECLEILHAHLLFFIIIFNFGEGGGGM